MLKLVSKLTSHYNCQTLSLRFRILYSCPNQFKFVLARVLGMFKNPTAEELYKMILAKKVTYEEIRRLDEKKFADLEMTMRMLYDHSSVGLDSKGSVLG